MDALGKSKALIRMDLDIDAWLRRFLPRHPERAMCHYPTENDGSSFGVTYSQCAANMERFFSGSPVSNEEFALIGDTWSRFEDLFVKALLNKGNVIHNSN